MHVSNLTTVIIIIIIFLFAVKLDNNVNESSNRLSTVAGCLERNLAVTKKRYKI